MSKFHEDFGGCFYCIQSERVDENNAFCKLKKENVQKGNSCILNSVLPDDFPNAIRKRRDSAGENMDNIKIYKNKMDLIHLLGEEEYNLEESNWIPEEEKLKNISMYASMFRHGDAIWIDDEWKEVISKNNNLFVKKNEEDIYPHPVNLGRENNYKADISGFIDDKNNSVFQISSLYDLALDSTDKLIWLGDSSNHYGNSGAVLLKGNAYKPIFKNEEWVFRDEYGVEYPVSLDGYTKPTMQKTFQFNPIPWGIIPRYKRILNS